MTATQLAYRALRDIGCLRAGGTTSPDILNDILNQLNDMIDEWQMDRFMMFTIAISTFNLQGGKQSYTIGPIGTDFVAPRPTRIENANIILNTVTPSVRVPLEVINDAQFSLIPVRDIPRAIPLRLFYDGGFDSVKGFATLFFWPGPLVNYQYEQFAWQQLQSFADLNTSYLFPPGYANCLRKNLAVQIAPMMEISSKVARLAQPRQSLLQLVMKQAADAKAALQSYNAPAPVMACDEAYMDGRGGGFNYATGEGGRR